MFLPKLLIYRTHVWAGNKSKGVQEIFQSYADFPLVYMCFLLMLTVRLFLILESSKLVFAVKILGF